LGPSIAKAAREVRISPDTGDGGRQAGEGNRDGGGETEDPAGEGARASHPAGGIGEAEGMAEARRGRGGRKEDDRVRRVQAVRAV